MAVKFLGQFLLEKGAINKQQLLAALEAQQASNPLLGELAQSRGWLTEAQSRQINERQRAEDRRFGDIAEAMGLLDGTQIDDLVAAQKAQRRFFGEILVEQGSLSREQLAVELDAHQQDRDDALQTLELGIADRPLGAALTSVINTCTRLFPRTLGRQCLFSSLVASADELAGFELTARVHVASSRPLTIAMACSRQTALDIGCAFLSLAPAECDDELALDALGELVNVLMGYVVKDALPEDSDYRAHPPQSDLPAAMLLRADGNALAVHMASQGGPFALIVSH